MTTKKSPWIQCITLIYIFVAAVIIVPSSSIAASISSGANNQLCEYPAQNNPSLISRNSDTLGHCQGLTGGCGSASGYWQILYCNALCNFSCSSVAAQLPGCSLYY